MLSHEEVRDALSARIDGEQPLLDDAVVDAHLAQCEPCREYFSQALALGRQLHVADGDGQLTPPDLSDVILAGVDDPWRKMAQRRIVTLTIGRVALVVMALTWAAWAVQSVAGGAAGAGGVTDAAVRFGVATSLALCAWRPAQVPGVLLIVGTMFTFTAGFAVRDAVLGAGELGPGVVVVPLITALALVWTWVADRGIEVRRAWSYLSANPS
ncbi:zf-HC2 domain-containing protein [Corynebacterium sp. Q4381]|uniref:zf-HC2 domain-containing protein n=1 Tax=Corynebacterium sp. Marseille-Q4381 TaxID=3121597 RepID=UPI002FE6BF5B